MDRNLSFCLKLCSFFLTWLQDNDMMRLEMIAWGWMEHNVSLPCVHYVKAKCMGGRLCRDGKGGFIWL